MNEKDLASSRGEDDADLLLGIYATEFLLNDRGEILWHTELVTPPKEEVIGTRFWRWARTPDASELIKRTIGSAVLDDHATECRYDAFVDGSARTYTVRFERLPTQQLLLLAIARRYDERVDLLSPTELRVLRLFAVADREEIGRHLEIARSTVDTHLNNISGKTGLSGSDLVRFAARHVQQFHFCR